MAHVLIIPKGIKNVLINSLGTHPSVAGLGDNDIQLFTRNGVHLAGTPLDDFSFSFDS